MPTFDNGEPYRWPVTSEASVPGNDVYSDGYTVTAIDQDAGVITMGQREPVSWTPEFWTRVRQEANENPGQWQRMYEGRWVNDMMRAMPEPTTWRLSPFTFDAIETEPTRTDPDAFEMRMRSYANIYTPRWGMTWNLQALDEPTVPAFDEAWIHANESRYYRDACWNTGSCGSCDEYRAQALEKYERLYGVDRHKNWVKFWENLALAHTAAIFMLEIHWDGKEQRFANADAIRAAIGA